MTDMFEREQAEGRQAGAPLIQQELRQFKALQHLSNHDVAFRMAMTLREVRKLRKMYNHSNHKLYDTGIAYDLRIILGRNGIQTTGDLLSLTDKDLLNIPRIGQARVDHIRQKLKEFFA